jgi:hypothetical protein
MIWYDICIVGYSNQYFPGKVTLTPSWNFTGSKNVKDSTDLGKAVNYMRNLIGKVTKGGNQHWAMGEFNLRDTEKRYGWVQCSPYLSKDECRQCLEHSHIILLKGDEPRIGSRVPIRGTFANWFVVILSEFFKT